MTNTTNTTTTAAAAAAAASVATESPQFPDHPEPMCMDWSRLEICAIAQYGREMYAAGKRAALAAPAQAVAPAKINRYCLAKMRLSTDPEHEPNCSSAASKSESAGGHWAPFAHPYLSIRMTLPIFLARQFVKHQIGGVWSEESRRYSSDEPGVWFPQEWHTRPEDIKQGSGGLVLDQHTAQALAENATVVALDQYRRLLREGVAPEEARTILPLNMLTTVTWTGSLLFWSRVCNQRLDSHAQLAAQELAKQIADIAQPLFPVSWAALVGE